MIDNGAAQAVKIFHRHNRKEAPLYVGGMGKGIGAGWDAVGRFQFHRLVDLGSVYTRGPPHSKCRVRIVSTHKRQGGEVVR